MSDFVKVGSVDEIDSSGMLLTEIDDRFVIVFRVNDRWSCIDDVCTHDGGTLSDGELEEGCIACPRHGAKFDIVTGEAKTMPATQDTYAHEVMVEGKDVYVKLNPAAE